MQERQNSTSRHKLIFGVSISDAQACEPDNTRGSNIDRYYDTHAPRLAVEASQKLGNLPGFKKVQESGVNPDYFRFGERVRHRAHYEEDFDKSSEIGIEVIRTGFEMFRFFPEMGVVNQQEIDFMKRYVEQANKRGIQIIGNIFHWALPCYLEDIGGFKNKETVKRYVDFADLLGREFGDTVGEWVSANEMIVYAAKGYWFGDFPPGDANKNVLDKISNLVKIKGIVDNMIEFHKGAYQTLKDHNSDTKIGVTQNIILFKAYKDRPHNILGKIIAELAWNDYVFRRIGGKQDFLGVNHYFPLLINNNKKSSNDDELNDIGWSNTPESILDALVYVNSRFGHLDKPIYIMEHGTAFVDSQKKSDFIRRAVPSVLRAIQLGIPVERYNIWTLHGASGNKAKVPEWDYGSFPHFGIIDVDDDFRRSIGPSGREYQRVIASYRQNGV